MLDDKIKDRDLNDYVDVILVYAIDKLRPTENTDEAKKQATKDERTLRAFQKKFPSIPGDLKKATIEVINKYELDTHYIKILERIPAAPDLAKEYKNKPEED